MAMRHLHEHSSRWFAISTGGPARQIDEGSHQALKLRIYLHTILSQELWCLTLCQTPAKCHGLVEQPPRLCLVAKDARRRITGNDTVTKTRKRGINVESLKGKVLRHCITATCKRRSQGCIMQQG